MERLIESGKVEEIIFARFQPGEDILYALYVICKQKDIRTGVILDGSGSAVDFTYQRLHRYHARKVRAQHTRHHRLHRV